MDAMSYPQHERALIATLAQQPRWIAQVATVLKPHHFSIAALGEVYEHMVKAKAISAATLQPLLGAESIAALGGLAGLAELLDGAAVPDPITIAEEIIAAYRRRVAVQALTVAGERIRRGEPITEAVAGMLAALGDVADAGETDLADVEQLFARYVEHVAATRATGFGLRGIDAAIGGLREGRLHIVAAPPGGGKTTLMVQAALNAAGAGRVALYLSSEMSEEELVAMAVTNISGVSLSPVHVRQYLAQGGMPDAVRVALERLKTMRGKWRIVRKAAPTLAEIELFVQRYLPAGGLLLVDYLQIMGRPANAQNREQEVNYNAMGLKALAVKYGIAVLTGAQLNQEGAVRESTAPLHHADVMLRIELPDQAHQLGTSDVPVNMVLLKNRGGATGAREVYFARAKARFFTLDRDVDVK